MSTQLAFAPVDEPTYNLLSYLGDTPPMRDVFRGVCFAVAHAHGGWINPNLVNAGCRARYDALGVEFDPQSYSAQWAPARGHNGFLRIHKDRPVPIDAHGSKGNGNKALFFHTLRSP